MIFLGSFVLGIILLVSEGEWCVVSGAAINFEVFALVMEALVIGGIVVVS